MSRFGIRQRLIHFLGGFTESDLEEEFAEADGKNEVQITPDSPLGQAILGAAREQGIIGGVQTPTVRSGPNKQGFGLKIIDCEIHMDPHLDAEVQALLRGGWEPLSMLKAVSFSGDEFVRMYFKRANEEAAAFN